MKTSPYVRQEKAIATADSGAIWERWIWGLRLLRDPEAIAKAGGLKHGVADQIITAVTASGGKLSAREIQRRLQCARTYPTEAQIRLAVADFETWRDLSDANFPPYEAPDGEPPADHRTDDERAKARRRDLLDFVGEQSTLFPADDFEPVSTPLKDLVTYAEQMAELTARFAKRDRERFAYLDRLREAADYDLSVTWHDAHQRLVALNAASGEEPVPDMPQLSAA